MPLTRHISVAYDHVQSVASTTWTINHNLGFYPIVDAYVTHEGELQRILPLEVIYVDANTCTLSFTIPRAGFASVM